MSRFIIFSSWSLRCGFLFSLFFLALAPAARANNILLVELFRPLRAEEPKPWLDAALDLVIRSSLATSDKFVIPEVEFSLFESESGEFNYRLGGHFFSVGEKIFIKTMLRDRSGAIIYSNDTECDSGSFGTAVQTTMREISKEFPEILSKNAPPMEIPKDLRWLNLMSNRYAGKLPELNKNEPAQIAEMSVHEIAEYFLVQLYRLKKSRDRASKKKLSEDLENLSIYSLGKFPNDPVIMAAVTEVAFFVKTNNRKLVQKFAEKAVRVGQSTSWPFLILADLAGFSSGEGKENLKLMRRRNPALAPGLSKKNALTYRLGIYEDLLSIVSLMPSPEPVEQEKGKKVDDHFAYVDRLIQSGQTTKAVDELEYMARLYPEDHRIFLRLGGYYRNSDGVDREKKLLLSSLDLVNNPEPIFARITEINKGKRDLVGQGNLADIRVTLDASKANYDRLLDLLMTTQNFTKADERAEEMAFLYPEDKSPYYFCASAAMALGNDSKAKKCIDKGNRLYPGDRDFQRLESIMAQRANDKKSDPNLNTQSQ